MLTIPEILKDKYTASLFAVALAVLIVAFFIAHINFFDTNNLLIIHLDVFAGADFFGDYGDVLGIISVAGLIWLINIILANELYYKERFLSYLLAFSTFAFMMLILLVIDVIISIN